MSDKEKISSKNELNVRKFGIIVEKGYKRGVLLPNLEGISEVDIQIRIAKQKAGIEEGDEDIDLYRFEVQRHEA